MSRKKPRARSRGLFRLELKYMSQITVSHLTFAYDGACDNVFEDVSFVLDTDWRLGFTGRNGRGKTTLLRLLQGALPCGGAVRSTVPCDYF